MISQCLLFESPVHGISIPQTHSHAICLASRLQYDGILRSRLLLWSATLRAPPFALKLEGTVRRLLFRASPVIDRSDTRRSATGTPGILPCENGAVRWLPEGIASHCISKKIEKNMIYFWRDIEDNIVLEILYSVVKELTGPCFAFADRHGHPEVI